MGGDTEHLHYVSIARAETAMKAAASAGNAIAAEEWRVLIERFATMHSLWGIAARMGSDLMPEE
jgi:hypothetical protein